MTMQHLLVYGDSLTWGIIPETRRRLPFAARWPGVMEQALVAAGRGVRVIEDCLNGRRTVWDDPYKPGRNGLDGLEQRIEINSPLALVLVMLGTNDFQSMHRHDAVHSAEGLAAIVRAIRRAPIEPGMPVPEVLVVAPPPMRKPQGALAWKFAGGEKASQGLGAALAEMAHAERCRFFDAATVTPASCVDGIHLDADQHAVLGRALAAVVAPLLGRSRASASRSVAGARSARDPRPRRPRASPRRPR
jgi:lysophospholipase L1-like esterase